MLFHIMSHMARLLKKKKFIEHKMCVLFSLQLLLETFLNLRRIQSDIINVHRSTHTVHIILVRF